MVKDISDLKKEEDEMIEWDLNPIKRCIQRLFAGELSNSNYRRKTLYEVYDLVEKEFTSAGIFDSQETGKKSYKMIASSLLRSIKKKSTVEEAILVIGDYLID